MMVSLTVSAQDNKDQIKTLRTAFLTTELELTLSEAERFWPVYNEYIESEHEIRVHKIGKLRKELKDVDQLSEKQSSEILRQLIQYEKEHFSLRSKLRSDLEGILSNKKILKLYYSEIEFNKKLLRQYKNQNKQ